MLDPKFIRENIEKIILAAQQKKVSFAADVFLNLYEARSQSLQLTEALRRTRNEGSDNVKKASNADERTKLVAEMRLISEQLTAAETALRAIELEFEEVLLTVPSIPSEDTPIGASDADNVQIKLVGTLPRFNFKPKDHIELGTSLGIVDFKRGTEIAGSRSYFLVGQGAELERAVHSFTLDLLKERRYKHMSVPVLVRTSAMVGTGYLPGGRDQAYNMERDDMWLVGTSEVSLASFHANETIDSSQLPIRFAAHSSCFRREAGAHGKDTKGLYRVHQFQKIEQVVICEPDIAASDKLHAELLKNSEDIMTALELPYRVVQVCTGDLGQGQVKKNDIEAWMPSREGYGETHSCSSFYDFQARRLKIKAKDANGKTTIAFTLNNTAAATPRLLIPLLEIHQTEQGTVKIPKVLQKYMNGLTEILPQS